MKIIHVCNKSGSYSDMVQDKVQQILSEEYQDEFDISIVLSTSGGYYACALLSRNPDFEEIKEEMEQTVPLMVYVCSSEEICKQLIEMLLEEK